jgi:hypothetical protein
MAAKVRLFLVAGATANAQGEKLSRGAMIRDWPTQMGLAKVCQREEKYQRSLAAIDAAAKVGHGRTDIHWIIREGETL